MRRALVVLPFLVLLAACDAGGSEEVAAPVACEAPAFAPTEFPWNGPTSEPETFSAQLNSISQWLPPPDYKQAATLTLVRRYNPWEDTEGSAEVPVRGTQGRVVWIGDPGTGEVSLQWSEGDASCEHYGLYLLHQSLAEREAEKELARIARSLR